jgi:hypothetical protein
MGELTGEEQGREETEYNSKKEEEESVRRRMERKRWGNEQLRSKGGKKEMINQK